MAKDVRQLRDDAAAATQSGKHKRAIQAYLELERLEPRDAQWPKRTAESYRRLGKTKEAVSAYERAADRYTQGGFMVQAIAVCKLILQLDPENSDATRRLAGINETQEQGPTRIGSLADNHPSLHSNTAVAALRDRAGTIPPADRGLPPAGGLGAPLSARGTGLNLGTPPAAQPSPTTQTASFGGDLELELDDGAGELSLEPAAPSVAASLPRSPAGRARGLTPGPPINLRPGGGLVDVALGEVIHGARAHRDDGSSPGVFEIPLEEEALDEDDVELLDDGDVVAEPSVAGLELEMLDVDADDPATPVHRLDPAELDEPEELALDDLEEIPLAAPKALSNSARAALAETPLLAGLSPDALEALIERIELVSVAQGETLFREGEVGDALYIISEGQVAVQSEGPPRVEIGRLGPGAFFGEVALVTDQPRSATVTALAACELLKIDRDILGSLLADYPEVLKLVLRFVRDRLVERLVLTSPLFRPFDDSERRALAARFKFLEIERGASIIAAGTKADGLYIVLAGRFGTHRESGPEFFGPGDLIGENSLLAGEKFDKPVQAIGKALALCLPASEFRELIMTHPHVLEYVGEHAEARGKVQMV
ncbi:MAG: cyclic nucleotide-binding domain-containing protein [Kofleriaceae bacterium]